MSPRNAQTGRASALRFGHNLASTELKQGAYCLGVEIDLLSGIHRTEAGSYQATTLRLKAAYSR